MAQRLAWMLWATAGLALFASRGGGEERPAVDHAVLDLVLSDHVKGDLVDYDSLARDMRLGTYLTGLATVDPASLATEAERLAFWINAYNAYTLQVVLDHGTPTSIRDIVARGRDGRNGNAWQTPVVRVGDRRYTLDEVEHDVIRERFDEPRVHFALICAARGCPPLRSEAYTGPRLDEQLESQGLKFLHGSAKGCRVDPSTATVWVSEIFEWYKADFGEDDAALGRFIAHYLPDSMERRVLERGRFQLRVLPFDWTLNGVQAGGH